MNIALGTVIGAFFLLVGVVIGRFENLDTKKIEAITNLQTCEFRNRFLENTLQVYRKDYYDSCAEILTLCSENETINRSEVVEAYKICMGATL